jgi:hypothetical protein
MGVPAGKDEIPLSHMVGTLGRPSKTQFIAPIVLRRPAEHHIKRPDWPGKRAEIKGVRQVHSATSEEGHFAALIRGARCPLECCQPISPYYADGGFPHRFRKGVCERKSTGWNEGKNERYGERDNEQPDIQC